MIIKLRIYLLLFLCAGCCRLSAQDVHFTQAEDAPLLLCPALAGMSNLDYRVSLNYKNQWPGVAQGYNTISAGFDLPLFRSDEAKRSRGGYLGAGVHVFKDFAGAASFGVTNFGLTITGVTPLSYNQKASFGLQAGVSQRSANADQLTWSSQYINGAFDKDGPTEGDRLSSNGYADWAFGLAYEFESESEDFAGFSSAKVKAGMSVYHFNKPKVEIVGSVLDVVYRKQVYFVNGIFDIGETRYAFNPSFTYYKQGPNKEFLIGMVLRMRMGGRSKFTGINDASGFGFGLIARLGDAIAPTINYQKNNFQFGLSYDINYSRLSRSTNSVGGAEISLKFIPKRSTPYMHKFS